MRLQSNEIIFILLISPSLPYGALFFAPVTSTSVSWSNSDHGNDKEDNKNWVIFFTTVHILVIKRLIKSFFHTNNIFFTYFHGCQWRHARGELPVLLSNGKNLRVFCGPAMLIKMASLVADYGDSSGNSDGEDDSHPILASWVSPSTNIKLIFKQLYILVCIRRILIVKSLTYRFLCLKVWWHWQTINSVLGKTWKGNQSRQGGKKEKKNGLI